MIKHYLNRLLGIWLLATGVAANSAVAETVDLSPYDTYEEVTIYLSWYDEKDAEGSLLILPCKNCSSKRFAVDDSIDLYQGNRLISFTTLTPNRAYTSNLTIDRKSQSLLSIRLPLQDEQP
ncbi:hypothetical protein [Kistimonas asteriae]|uniref:hypothetical protein n=1 Tax=Kistimonas asteriae TaxID=517724 RepID=UPI001BAA0ADC|nr:hypothetical protein [Kistimonas asteriae]